MYAYRVLNDKETTGNKFVEPGPKAFDCRFRTWLACEIAREQQHHVKKSDGKTGELEECRTSKSTSTVLNVPLKASGLELNRCNHRL